MSNPEDDEYCFHCAGTGCEGWQSCWDPAKHENCTECGGTGSAGSKPIPVRPQPAPVPVSVPNPTKRRVKRLK